NGGGAAEQIVEWPAGGRPPVSQPAHIVWTTDGPTHTGFLYVNGVLVGSNLNMTITPAAVGPTFNDWLGKSQFAADPYFNVTIDDSTVIITITKSLRLPNTTVTVPISPPPTAYQFVDAFPGVTFTQPLAMRTPAGVAYSNLLFVVERRGLITYIDATAANPIKQ